MKSPGDTPTHTNALAAETSPYLLQHVHNPVNWYPWSSEALGRARELNRPIFLSIGYSACHWCHVMERESFENAAVAAFLNDHFISIKVDREERPDLDDLYMSAVQRMTGSGGWPMTVFLTPERKPFYGGTYFPPTSKYGRPGFLELIRGIDHAWKHKRDEILDSAEQLSEMIHVELPEAPAESALPEREALIDLLRATLDEYHQDYDAEWGGFGGAPKFPRTDDLRLMLTAAPLYRKVRQDKAMVMIHGTLDGMAAGGMYDQIGGGFARYSVDEKWWVPHFEKMLYDQGTLLPTYALAWAASHQPRYERVVRQTCDYLLRERQDPQGAFWSATDADSEGVEGKFFVWTPQELKELLGEEKAAFAMERYGVTEAGTFEHGSSVLRDLPAPEAAPKAWEEEVRAALHEAREQRIAPGNDDKILTAWNGLAIDALATASRTFGVARYAEAAQEAAEFLLRELRSEDGEWSRSWRAGKAQHRAVLEDYSYLCRGFLSLFQSTGEECWLQEAVALARIMIDLFWDEASGVFFDTDGQDASLLHRNRTPWDGATPSPNAVALESLLQLFAFTQGDEWRRVAHRGLASLWPAVQRTPRAFAATLRLYSLATDEPRVAVVIGTGSDASLTPWRSALHQPGAPQAYVVLRTAAKPSSGLGLFQNREALDGKATLYLCDGPTCRTPLTDPEQL